MNVMHITFRRPAGGWIRLVSGPDGSSHCRADRRGPILPAGMGLASGVREMFALRSG